MGVSVSFPNGGVAVVLGNSDEIVGGLVVINGISLELAEAVEDSTDESCLASSGLLNGFNGNAAARCATFVKNCWQAQLTNTYPGQQ